jgi:hypothetical protein
MFARKGKSFSVRRPAAIAVVTALALTAIEPSASFAGSAPSGNGLSTASTSHTATDFSARRRVYRNGNGGAAAAAAFAGIVGTGIAIAAAQNNRSYYDSYDGYYGGGPAYYGGGPVYYGGGPYYGGYGGYRSGVPYFHGHPNAGW